MNDLKLPRPWEAVFEKERRLLTIVKDGWPLAYVEWDEAYGYDEPGSEDWAVARLMAAAPELLELLELALAAHNRLLASDSLKAAWAFGGFEAKAQAAIAKVKGEE